MLAFCDCRAYDRAAIKFRGVDADINFTLTDYQEDLDQVRIFFNDFQTIITLLYVLLFSLYIKLVRQMVGSCLYGSRYLDRWLSRKVFLNK